MQKLAESSGTVAYEINNVVKLVRKPAQWTSTFLYVSWLITVITIANAILPFVLDPKTEMKSAAYVLSGIALLFFTISLAVGFYRNKINAIPLSQLETICIFDFNTGKLLDSQGVAIADIRDVKIRRAMQITSSSPSLSIVADRTKIKLVKGNPFSGGISAIERVLLNRGIEK